MTNTFGDVKRRRRDFRHYGIDTYQALEDTVGCNMRLYSILLKDAVLLKDTMGYIIKNKCCFFGFSSN